MLGSFADSVNEATKSLTNLPKGINLAALEFQAQAASRMTWDPTWGTDPRGEAPALPPRRGTGGFDLPVLQLSDALDVPIKRMAASLSATEAEIADLKAELASGSLSANLGKFADALASLAQGDSISAARKLEALLDEISLRRYGTTADRIL